MTILKAYIVLTTQIHKPINAIYTASVLLLCLIFFCHLWADSVVQHKSCLSTPIAAAAVGCVIVRQANGMENAAFEVSN